MSDAARVPSIAESSPRDEAARAGLVAPAPAGPADAGLAVPVIPTPVPPAPEPGWVVELTRPDLREASRESVATIGDGRFGTRGAREEDGPGASPSVLASGIYETRAGQERLLEGPVWTGLSTGLAAIDGDRRWLDLRRGVLVRELVLAGETVHLERFCSLARPGVTVLTATGPAPVLDAGAPLRDGHDRDTVESGVVGDVSWMKVPSDLGGGITAAAAQHDAVVDGHRRVERIAAYLADADHLPETRDARARLADALDTGRADLRAEHERAWAERWEAADIVIEGDPEVQEGVRYSLFQLMGTVASEGEAPVGARGLAGPGYLGHVFWDSDVFVLPFFAATHPASARAMLDYRLARLDAARQEAAAHRLAGAHFPWESGRTGREVTPKWVRDPHGAIIPIRTGDKEEHIVADIAWAATEYVVWTGDTAFEEGEGRELLRETARFWVSRIRVTHDGKAHIYGVIGPDEYREVVDDNAFTNVMARWNLRRAADLERRCGGDPAEIAHWEELADALVDGYDPHTGLYEQCAGFYGLDPLLITELTTVPIAADLELGRELVQGAQVVKQPDVMMALHLVPGEMAPGSLEPNVDFYLPRTAHGSSLSPAVCASLLARAGRPDEALTLFRTAARIDLDDITGTTPGGLHVATMGGVWQALVHGFAGVRPRAGGIEVDPRLPSTWDRLEVRVRVGDVAVRISATATTVEVTTTGGDIDVAAPGAGVHRTADGHLRLERRGDAWEAAA